MSITLQDLDPVWRPHAGQQEFIESTARIRVLACGRRWGKTDASAAATLLALGGDAPTHHLIIAPILVQARLLFDRVVALLEECIERAILPNQHMKARSTPFPRLEYGPHTVTARSGQIGRFLRGQEATHILVDEAAFCPESLITEVAMPMLATSHGQLTLISTPCGQNHFWRFFEMGQDGRHGVWSRRAFTSESPYVYRRSFWTCSAS